MAPHSSTLAWKIPWTEEPGGLPSMGSHRVGHDWSDLAAPAVQLICSVVSDSLCPHGLQHTRPHCSSPTPGVYSNSCPLNQWYHPTISSSVVPFSLLQSFPSISVFSSESVLHIRWPRFWSFSFSISLSNEYSGLISFRMDWFDLLARDSQESSPTPQFKSISSLVLSFFIVQLSYSYMTTGKIIALTRQTFVGKVMSLLFNMLGWS